MLRYRYNREFKADRGRHGEGSNCSGVSGDDTVLKVPVGTLVFDSTGNVLLADLKRPGQRLLVAQGGRGGRGEQKFWKPRDQGPREKGEGEAGGRGNARVELKRG